jgi:Ca-activated chloride channel family protein
VLVGRYSGKGDSAVIVEGTVAGANRKFTYEVKFPGESDEHEFIPRLWATRRVGYLLDEIRLHGENAELRDEVTELARKYGIVTPYTAYLIVEDEDRRRVPLSMQSLPQLRDDSEARREAAANWDGYKKDTVGEEAAFRSRYGLALKSANAPAPAAAAGAVEATRALKVAPEVLARSTAPAADSKTRLVQYSQQGQFRAGKNFYQNNSQWVDTEVQKLQNAKRVRVQFNSPEYFELARKEPKALPWLALGEEVQFELNKTVYEVYK